MQARVIRTHFKTPFGCDRLQSPWICVIGKKGSRRASARLRAFFTSGLDHELFARSRFKISFEMSSSHKSKFLSYYYAAIAAALWIKEAAVFQYRPVFFIFSRTFRPCITLCIVEPIELGE